MKTKLLLFGLVSLATSIAYQKGVSDGKLRFIEFVGLGSKAYLTRDEMKQIEKVYEKALERIHKKKI